MIVKQQNDWLSLSGAAAMLGVHPSTVRLWSNKGVIPVHHTTGGHRRYLRHEIELWSKAASEKHIVEPFRAMQSAIGKLRMQIADGRLEAESWYQKLEETSRIQFRPSGMLLVNGLLTYLSSDDPAAGSQASSIGFDYATRARRSGLDSIDAVRAFLFFRNTLLESLVNAYENAHVPPGLAWGRMLNRIHSFTDQILIVLLQTYHLYD